MLMEKKIDKDAEKDVSRRQDKDREKRSSDGGG